MKQLVASLVGPALAVSAGSGWTVITPIGLPSSVQRIQFTDRRVGWAIARGAFVNVHDELLYKTTDGGHSWKRVGY